MNQTSFWRTPIGIAIRWIVFLPLFLTIWIFGLNICSLASGETDFFLRIPIFGASAIIGTLVIGLPALITGLPKIMAAILTPVFVVGSIFIFVDMAKNETSGRQLAAIIVFSLMAMVTGFAVFNIDKK